MYKTAVRALIRHGIGRPNDGDPSFLLRLASSEMEIAFPGENSWASMHRPVEKGRHRYATHRGIDECRAFADRFVQEGLHFEIEDILVNGGPWNTRVALRAHDHRPGPEGDEYNNRVVAFLEIKWGRLVSWEDYEDTERIAVWDRHREVATA
jgi:ketosteroid isomerase-like protein